MDAIAFLIREHDKIRVMLAEIGDNSCRFEKRIQLFNVLVGYLLRHEVMEHKIWYPSFKNDSRLSAEVKHLLKEENEAEKAIQKLSDISNEKEWEEKYASFQSKVMHHTKEEEEKLFPEVKRLLDETKLEMIGKEMKEFIEKYKESVAQKIL